MNAPFPRGPARPDSPTLFLPGPTEVHPDILQELARPPIGHRGPEIQELLRDVEEGLQQLLHTQQPVLPFTASATTIMEAAIRNTVHERGVLHLTCGAFSEKWFHISQSMGRPAEAVAVEWGQGFTPERVAQALEERSFDAVCLTHNETSTGVMNPLPEIARVVREVAPDTLLLVDAVSSMAAVDIHFDECGADVLLAGVQKAFALPPGLAVAAVSERALARAKVVPHRGMVQDFLEILRYLEKFQTPSTPSTPHLYGLRAQLRRILDEGMEQREARHRAMAARAQAFAREKWKLFTDENFLSPTVTCITVPEATDPADLRAHLKSQGIVLGGGYGKLKPTTYRIGHMGEHTMEGLEDLLGRIDQWQAGGG